MWITLDAEYKRISDPNFCTKVRHRRPRRLHISFIWPILTEDLSTSDSSDDAYYDPALFGIMGALALMFIIMCVVLQLFARSAAFINL